jgi:hypothetical protein
MKLYIFIVYHALLFNCIYSMDFLPMKSAIDIGAFVQQYQSHSVKTLSLPATMASKSFEAFSKQSSFNYQLYLKALQSSEGIAAVQAKVLEVNYAIGNAVSIMNGCLGSWDKSATMKSCIDMLTLHISEIPQIEAYLQDTIRKLEPYFFQNGMYSGLRDENLEAVTLIITKFEKTAGLLLQDYGFEVLGDYRRQSSCFPAVAYNADLLKVIEYSKQNMFDQADRIIQTYKNMRTNQIHSIWEKFFGADLDHPIAVMEAARKEFWDKKYTYEGIDRTYEHNPFIAERAQGLSITRQRQDVANHVMNEKLASDYAAMTKLLESLGVPKDNKILEEIAYHVAQYQDDALGIISYLGENLSIDHQDPARREAFKAIYDAYALPKIINYQSRMYSYIRTVELPATINNAHHAQDRITLGKLLTHPVDSQKDIELVKTGIDYIKASCKELKHAHYYSNLARDIADALVFRNMNKAVLSLDNYCSQQVLSEQLHNQVVPIVADLADRLWFDRYLPNDIHKQCTLSLQTIDFLWKEASSGNEIAQKTLSWVIKDGRDAALERSQEFLHSVQEKYKNRCDEIKTITKHDIVDVTHNFKRIKKLAPARADLYEHIRNSYAYVYKPKCKKEYMLSAHNAQLLEQCKVDPVVFKTSFGNELQQLIHGEFLNILNAATTLYKSTTVRDAQQLSLHAIEFAHVGALYNQEQHLKKAITVANCCWALLDCAFGIAEGAFQGLDRTVGALLHPIDTLTTTAQALAQVVEIAYVAGGMVIAPYYFKERYGPVRDAVTATIGHLKECIASSTPRDVAREATALVTESLLTGKLAGACSNFFTTAKSSFGKVLKSLEKVTTKEQALALAVEGVPIQMTVAQRASEKLFNFMENLRDKPGKGKNAVQAIENKPFGEYHDASYHTPRGNVFKSKSPIDGQMALDNSVPFNVKSNRRVGISKGEFVVMGETREGFYHGHVRPWDELEQEMKNALKKAGMANDKGKILKIELK